MAWSTEAGGPLNCDPCYGTLTINDVLLHTPAWCLPDLSALWGSFELRGANRLIPGRRGRKPYVRRADETRYSLPLLVTGYCDAAGIPWTDPGGGYSDFYSPSYEHVGATTYEEGLENNLAFLQRTFHLDDPSDTAESVFDAVFELPSLTTRESRVQVLGIRGQLLPGALFRATLEILDVDAGLILMGVGV